MDERLEGIRFIIESKLEDVIALTQIVATEVVKVKPKNEYWHIYNYLEALLKTRLCKDAVEKRLGITKDVAIETEFTDDRVPSLLEEENKELSEEELAALQIQMAYKNYRQKSIQIDKENVDLNDTLQEEDIFEQEQAACKIQKAFRARKRQSEQTGSTEVSEDELLSLFQQEDVEEQEQAAIKIQRAFRRGTIATSGQDKTYVEGSENEETTQRESIDDISSPSQTTPKRKVSNQRSRLSILSSWLPDLVLKRKSHGNIDTHQSSSPNSTNHTNVLRKNTWPLQGRQNIPTPSPTQISRLVQPNISPGLKQSLCEVSPSKSQLEIRNSKSPQNANVLDTLNTSTSSKQIRSTPRISKTTSRLMESEKFRSQPQISSLADGCLHITAIKQFQNPASITYNNVKTYSRTVDIRNNIKQKDDDTEEEKQIPPAPPSSPRCQSEQNESSAETPSSTRQRRSSSNNKTPSENK